MTAAAKLKADPPMLAAALGYAARRWPAIVVHNIVDDGCSCSKGTDCGAAGKHARTKNGIKDASTDPAIILGWYERWPDSNVGIVTGEVAGIFVLDIDVKNDGEEALAELEAKIGTLPATASVRTGGGGRHLYFDYPEGGMRNSASQIGPGIDIRGDGGFVVAPPSLHKSGNQYAWITEE